MKKVNLVLINKPILKKLVAKQHDIGDYKENLYIYTGTKYCHDRFQEQAVLLVTCFIIIK